MPDGLVLGSDLADWWEQQIKDFHRELEEYVGDNPNNFGIVVGATTAATAVDFTGAFFIDLMHLGEGFGTGGVKGIAQDLLRIAQFIPAGKVVKLAEPLMFSIKEAKFLRAASQNFVFWSKFQGGYCVPVAISQALLRTGQKSGVALMKIAEALGVGLDVFDSGKGANWLMVESALQKMGVQFRTFAAQGLNKFEQIAELVSRSGEPHMIRVLVGDAKKGHTFLVTKTAEGIVLIDRELGTGALRTFKSMQEMSIYYENLEMVIDTSVNIFAFKNVAFSKELLPLVEKLGLLACLVRTSLGIFDFNRSKTTPEFVKEDFKRFVQQKRGSIPIQMDEMNVEVGGKTIQVTPKTTLSDLAQAQYGDWKLWQLIYNLNKEKIGNNPNHLKTGSSLLMLPLSSYTPQEIAEAKKNSSTWKNFH